MLQAAPVGGYEKVVELLLSASAEVNANVQGGGYSNALYAESYCGYEKVVELLLGAGADVNAQGGYYGNALQAASIHGHEKVVELLLGGGAASGDLLEDSDDEYDEGDDYGRCGYGLYDDEREDLDYTACSLECGLLWALRLLRLMLC